MKFNKESFRKDIVLKRVVDLNLSIELAANQAGITPERMLDIESGKNPDMDEFMNLCTWLGSSRPGRYFLEVGKPVVNIDVDTSHTEDTAIEDGSADK